MPDAIVVGAGPNGLAAAITLAHAGLSVDVFESAATPGGGVRTMRDEATGTLHDWGAAVHPLALASPFFQRFGLTRHVEFVVPEISYAHPLDGGRAAIAWRDLDRTAEGLGPDRDAWQRLFAPLISRVDRLTRLALTPLAASALPLPRDPALAALVGQRVLQHGTRLGARAFRSDASAALLAGVIAHPAAPIPSLATAAAGLVLGALAHVGGWPVPVGGSGTITEALVAELKRSGGRIHLEQPVTDLGDLPQARAIMFDTSAGALLALGGSRLHPRYRRALGHFAHGNAASKVDYVLSEPVPWAAPGLADAVTLHVGGTRGAIAAAERAVSRGQHPGSPYVLVAQPGAVDPTRAPAGRHTLWAYTHVPAGSTHDMTDTITRQIERFAPGFRDIIVASAATPAASLAHGNPNFVGGDIATGAVSLRQIVARPVFSRSPWRAGTGLYLCSAAAAPGPGVHGMGGYQAALTALRDVFGLREGA